MRDLQRFLVEEDAMGTVEVVLIVAVLLGIGLLFKEKIVEFVTHHLDQVDDVRVDIESID